MKRSIILALCAAFVPAVHAAPKDAPCADAAKAAPSGWNCLTGASRRTNPEKTVLRDPAAWRKFWLETTGKADAPAVDFKAEAVAVEVLPGSAFRAVKVARGADDRTASAAASAYALSAERQAAAGERVGRMLAGARVPRAADLGDGAPASRPMGTLNGFDGAGLRDSVAAVPAAPRFEKVQLSCTPGVDCPEQQPVHRRPAPAPNCTPGVDCPENGQGRRPDCTRGVDCPEDGQGGRSPRTPLPPNYRPRPNNPPSTFPPVVNPDSYDRTVTSGWYVYRNRFGWPEETTSGWSDYGISRAVVERGGSERGQQGSAYTANLTSTADRPTYRLYWRYVGTNCNPNDDSECLDWGVQYARFLERVDRRSASMVVDVRFNDNGQKLLPWETESIGISFDGYRVGYDASSGAFRYAVNGPLIDQQTGRASLEFSAGARIKRRPEADKVVARLEKANGQLQLSILDLRADFYEGEPLEVVYQVKKDCNGWFCKDKVVDERRFDNPLRVAVAKGVGAQAVLPVAANGAGKYYVVWSFRRAQSKISSDGWVDQGKTSKIQY